MRARFAGTMKPVTSNDVIALVEKQYQVSKILNKMGKQKTKNISGDNMKINVKERSSQMEYVEYVPETKELHVKFQSGKAVYTYKGVSQEEYDGLMAAKSMGSYLHKNIKTHKVEKAEQ